MNNTFPVIQKAKTGDVITDLIMREHKLDKKAKFMETKSINQKLKQSEIAGELKIASSTLQRYEAEVNMLSLYRIQLSSNTHKRKQNTSNHTEHDLQMTSKWPQKPK